MHSLETTNVYCYLLISSAGVQDGQLNDMVWVPNWALVLPNLLFLVGYNWSYMLG